LNHSRARDVSTVETTRRAPIGDPDPIHRNYSLSIPFRLRKNARCHRRRHDPTPPVAAPPRIEHCAFPAPRALRRVAPDDGTRLAGRAHDNRYKLDTPEISQ